LVVDFSRGRWLAGWRRIEETDADLPESRHQALAGDGTEDMNQALEIQNRIDKFFETIPTKDSDAVKEFVKNLYESYCLAEKATQRQLFLTVTAWAVFYAIAQGIVSEAQIASFKISNVRYIAVLGPPVIGFLSYTLASSAFISLNLGIAFWQCIKHLLPQAYELDLERLLGPPTFLRAEKMSKHGEHQVHQFASMVWGGLFVAFGVIGTFVALVHVSYLTWSLDPLSRIVRVVAIVVGVTAWARGTLLWVRTADY
jgi:hypothetical protein